MADPVIVVELRGAKVVVESERGMLSKSARVLVFDGGMLIAEQHAEIQQQPGADGELYPTIVFKTKE